jgi:hypothetical protein
VSSEIQRCVLRREPTDISKKHAASFSGQKSKPSKKSARSRQEAEQTRAVGFRRTTQRYIPEDRILQTFLFIDVNCVLGLLHRMNMGDVIGI